MQTDDEKIENIKVGHLDILSELLFREMWGNPNES